MPTRTSHTKAQSSPNSDFPSPIGKQKMWTTTSKKPSETNATQDTQQIISCSRHPNAPSSSKLISEPPSPSSIRFAEPPSTPNSHAPPLRRCLSSTYSQNASSVPSLTDPISPDARLCRDFSEKQHFLNIYSEL